MEYLTEHFHEAPVWIVACLVDGPNPNRGAGASIYPAVQNMLLTIRALGLGSTLTTRHLLHAKESEAALGLPEGVHSYAILPIGYPMGNSVRSDAASCRTSCIWISGNSPFRRWRRRSTGRGFQRRPLLTPQLARPFEIPSVKRQQAIHTASL